MKYPPFRDDLLIDDVLDDADLELRFRQLDQHQLYELLGRVLRVAIDRIKLADTELVSILSELDNGRLLRRESFLKQLRAMGDGDLACDDDISDEERNELWIYVAVQDLYYESVAAVAVSNALCDLEGPLEIEEIRKLIVERL